MTNANIRALSNDAIENFKILIDVGLKILPARGKIPDARLVPRGTLDATNDIPQILAWARTSPNWAVVSPDGRIIRIDIDVYKGGRLASLGQLPPTWALYSGRGDGSMHIFFKVPEGADLVGRLGPGIEIKGRGASTIPPSVHPETKGAYRWAAGHSPSSCPLAAIPGPLLARLTRPPVSQPVVAESVDISREDIIEALWHIPPSCCREWWRNIGMILKDLGWPDGFAEWVEWSKQCPEKFNQNNRAGNTMGAQWRSFGRPPIRVNLGTLFWYAFRCGWRPGDDEWPGDTADEEQIAQFIREQK
jgi:hypothetical protein